MEENSNSISSPVRTSSHPYADLTSATSPNNKSNTQKTVISNQETPANPSSLLRHVHHISENNLGVESSISLVPQPSADDAEDIKEKLHLNSSLLKLKLLDCLRNNDVNKLNSLIEEVKSDKNLVSDDSSKKLLHQLLHLAVQVGHLNIIKYIVNNNLVSDINSQDESGNTPLHFASMSSRMDVIEFLMGLPSINDCIVNEDGKQAIETTSDLQTVQLLSDMRTKFVEIKANELRNAFEKRDFKTLENLLSSQRVRDLLDINGTDPITGDTVLLEFIKKDDTEMVKFILQYGGDPFKRNLNGKLPIDFASSAAMKAIIQENCKNQNIIDPSAPQQIGPPTFKGFLKKWTNFASGYKLRWFILDSDCRLSYYKSPNDINNTCRGMIHLANASLKMDSSEKSKFEIIINSRTGNPIRWHLKANHVIETNRWVWALQNAIRYAKDLDKQKRIAARQQLQQSQPQQQHHHDASGAAVGGSATVSAAAATAAAAAVVAGSGSAPSQLQIQSHLTQAPASHHQDNVLQFQQQKRNPKESFDSYRSNLDFGNSPSSPISVTSPNFNNLVPPFSVGMHQRNYSGASSVSGSSYSDDDFSQGSASSSKTKSAKKRFSKLKAKAKDKILSNIKENDSKSNLKSIGKKNKSKSQTSFKDADGSVPMVASSSTVVDSTKSKLGNATSSTLKQTSRPSSAYLNSSASNNNKYSSDEYQEKYSDYEDDNDDVDGDVDLQNNVPHGNEGPIGGYDDNEIPINELAFKHSDLIIIDNQIKMEIKSFNEFLNSSKSDRSLASKDVADVSLGILSNISSLLKKHEEVLKRKENKLGRYLERQTEVNNLWERSLKQLESEISKREEKIVELEDKLRVLRKSLKSQIQNPEETKGALAPLIHRLSIIETASPNQTDNLQGKTTSETSISNKNAPSAVSFPVPDNKSPEENTDLSKIASQTPDEEIIKFIEESDSSDDEFFDAEGEAEEEREKEEETFEAGPESAAVGEPTVAETHETEVKSPTEGKQESTKPQYEKESEVKADLTDKSAIASASEEDSQTVTPETPTTADSITTTTESTPSIKKSPIVASKVITHTKSNLSLNDVTVGSFSLKTVSQKEKYAVLKQENSFVGYEDPIRTTLGKKDDRPSISLWAILKSLIGKDMTRITLPVSFNEPTSLLQRVAEDMEYSDLLSKAATISDSTTRMVYVAAFAASEYASTIGRVAKPFNPLLGETYEYARPDKGYRFFIEQVSHRPPIGAAYAESPFWDYWGESNVKSKFLGRSFDIKPLGTWFLNIRPHSGVIDKSGKFVSSELYTWKKVTSSVIGIIVGNPTVDNYGEMEIVNHTTGDHMLFNFKPRGWRASSAYEVKGDVMNKKGEVLYTVGGRWDSKIFAKKVGSTEKVLIWEANKRTEMIFHLTNFAASLNAPQKSLMPVLPATDTRFRPDQRAMEDGQYDFAAEEKNRVEEKQRAARRAREESGEPYVPEFFSKKVHPITGDEYWEFDHSYWKRRKNGELKNYKDIF
ncbi:hypothetical protein BVG19_g2735 [[Candida] boidinii]|nr:hypothetical protein BVG19_g2735 [[Candida] boidinii]OWB49227.1 hypothetical protein B5S27_g767 [[Candida] boidinii]